MSLENGKKDNTAFWLKKVARISSWLLLAGIIVLVVSGWGITQTGAIYNASGGLINRLVANEIHRAAVFPIVIVFLLHVFINIWLGIKTKKRYVRQITAGVMLAAGAGVLWLAYYMEYVRLGG